ncbi:uncharacterized protein ARMOST_07539 [Armillaria ostoyae]|uniref:Reverse transcriptase domain-containing protein n=1 Tax=Armillaria ostoyae TaxID=47428 RepID=A0A284R644_ARMOS|nr:uncharacterized protein ARMOST_07539 [Armillaria ostoyae]
MPHSILFAARTTNQPHKESHNRYAILAPTSITDNDTVSTASNNEKEDATEHLASNLSTSLTDNHLTSSSSRVKVPGDKPPTIVVLIITASAHARLDGAEEPGPNPPPDEAAPQVENTTARKPIIIALPQDLTNKSRGQTGRETPKVTIIEVPDKEDDTSFRLHQAKAAAADADTCGPSPKRKSPYGDEAKCPSGNDTMVSKGQETAKHVPPMATAHEWLKPFETEWTWRAIKDAKDESAARAILLNWIHKTRAEEVIDDLLEVQLETLENPITVSAKALIDSGCTESSIHCDFVKKHGILVQDTASPISVYNADGSCNKAGEITSYAELRLKIRNHSERIDLAVTNLSSKEIFLRYNWLRRHNPVINWQTGSITFAHCHCAKNRFVLPDADPDNEWELEEGDTILAIDFEEAIEIHAIHKANELAAKANEGKEKKTFKQMVPEPYRDFEDLFAKESFDDLPAHKPWDHTIKLVPNAKNTLDCKVYLLNRIEQEELNKFLDENLASGHIQPSKSPMASPFFFVKKKDGQLHPVQDYRKLNGMMIKNRYPLPLISELMDKLGSAKYFTKLDVRWGYNNVHIKKDNKWKAAFRTNCGLFEPTVMFFGLTNSPATFQWMMNDIFKDLIATGKVTIYLDDILIFLKTLEEHQKITHHVLELLRKHKLFLKAEKCEFEVLETEYLGVIISKGSIRMDPIKVAGIAEWPVPTKKKEL